MDVRADRFPLVDSLRALAALAIVGYHALGFAGVVGSGSLGGRLATNLQVGVPVFFLISGFLLYRPFAKSRLLAEPMPRAGAYAWRRFLRIAPAYWVALTLAAALGLASSFAGAKILVYYGFGQIYMVGTYFGGLAQAWTLSVEVSFYALLPLWALALRRLHVRHAEDWLRQELVLLTLLLVASQAYKLVVALSVNVYASASQPLLMLLPNFLDLFALGMAVAVASIWLEQRHGGSRELPLLDARSWAPWALAALAFAAVAALGPTAHGATRAQFLMRHDLWMVCALGIVLPGMLGDGVTGLVRRLLATRTLSWLGLISYGIFLQHVTVVSQLRDWGFYSVTNSLAVWVIAVAAGSIALGAASYYLVERPALSLKRLVPAPRQVGAGEALAEAAPLAPPEARSAAPR
jgi:peptidoglycan/LPS O-acetylase OafA/YrhL